MLLKVYHPIPAEKADPIGKQAMDSQTLAYKKAMVLFDIKGLE
jgi:hypothetical protein